MSRSRHNGCGKPCAVCRPHKKWKTNSIKDKTAQEQRKSQKGKEERKDG